MNLLKSILHIILVLSLIINLFYKTTKYFAEITPEIYLNNGIHQGIYLMKYTWYVQKVKEC